MNNIEKLGFDNWLKEIVDLSPKGLGGWLGKARGNKQGAHK